MTFNKLTLGLLAAIGFGYFATETVSQEKQTSEKPIMAQAPKNIDPLLVIPTAFRDYFNDEKSLGSDGLKKRIGELQGPIMIWPFTVDTSGRAAQMEYLDKKNTDRLLEAAKDKYLIIKSNGQLSFADERMILDPKSFQQLYQLYNQGLVIQKLGFFDEGLKYPRRHAENFHFNKTLEDSLIEEIIGPSRKEDLPAKLAEYAGFPTSILYKVNPKTAKKAEIDSYLFTVYCKMITSPINDESVPVLFKWRINKDNSNKELIPTTTGSVYYTNTMLKNLKVEEGKVILIPGRNQNELKPYYVVQMLVIGDSLSTVGHWRDTLEHRFPAKFDDEIYIGNINKK